MRLKIPILAFKIILFTETIFTLESCQNVILNKGEYKHNFEGGHCQKIIIQNDSILSFERNVSMLDLKLDGKYVIQDDKIVFTERNNTFDDFADTFPYLKKEIKIRNKNILVLDGLKNKFQK